MPPATTETTAEVYLQFRRLPDSCLPAWVVRSHGMTLVAVDPRSTRADLACWSPDNLTDDEMNAYRSAYGEPPVGQPLGDAWMTNKPFPSDVPAALGLGISRTALLFQRTRETRERAQRLRAASQSRRSQGGC